MSADYFPRLSAVSGNPEMERRTIGEQTFVVLNVITPIIAAMIIFGKQILQILYSTEFTVADELLNWQLLGALLKVASWPMAFILLAKGKGGYYFVSEVSFFVVYFLSVYFLFPALGLDAARCGLFDCLCVLFGAYHSLREKDLELCVE